MKFYIRLRNVPLRFINHCLVFDGWKIYRCIATQIRGNMEFKEINI